MIAVKRIYEIPTNLYIKFEYEMDPLNRFKMAAI